MEVRVCHDRNLAPLEKTARNHVRIGRLVVDPRKQPTRDHIRQSYADRIAVCPLGQLAHDHGPDARRGFIMLTVHADAPGDIGIDSDAADVFAHAIDHQHIDLVHRQSGHVALRKFQQPRLLPSDRVGFQHVDPQCLVEGIFDQADACENFSGRKDVGRTWRDQLPQSVNPEVVNGTGALELSQANKRHLHQAAFIASVKIGVWLDPVDKDRAVGLVDVTVHEKPARQVSARQLDDVHGGTNRRADCRLGDAVRLQNRRLPFGRRSAVASHRRYNERLRAPCLQVIAHISDEVARLSMPRLPAAMAIRARIRITPSSARAVIAARNLDRPDACDRSAA